MQTVEYSLKYYPDLLEMIQEGGIENSEPDRLHIVMVLEGEQVIGFYAYERVKSMANLWHLFIRPSYRDPYVFMSVLGDILKHIRQEGYKSLVIHLDDDSKISKLFQKYGKQVIYRYKNVLFYKLEV